MTVRRFFPVSLKLAELLARHLWTMPPSRAVAVCFSGGQGRAVPDGGESIRRYLIRPLKADVLLALDRVQQVGPRRCR